METKTNESGKNWLIFILLVINIGLIALFVYSINLQKVMFADEPTKVVTKSKKWIVTLEDEKHLIRLVEDKKDVNVYYDDSLITTITNASVDNKNNNLKKKQERKNKSISIYRIIRFSNNMFTLETK